jgi:hypothetical protein
MRFIVSDINWDKETDGVIQSVNLPKSIEVEAENEDSAIDAASDQIGYCIHSASVIAIDYSKKYFEEE